MCLLMNFGVKEQLNGNNTYLYVQQAVTVHIAEHNSVYKLLYFNIQ